MTRRRAAFAWRSLALPLGALAWSIASLVHAAPSGEVSLTLDSAPEPLLDDTEKSTPNDVSWERFDNDDALRAHPVTVHRTLLTAKLDPTTHVVVGEETIRWTNTSRAAVNELFIHAYLNAFKNDRSIFLRGHLGGGRGNTLPTEWGFVDIREMRLVDGSNSVDLWAGADKHSPSDDEDETDLRVPLPSPVAPGQEIQLSIRFESKLPSIVERTGHLGSFHFVGQWFPKLARLREDGGWEHFTFHRLSEFASDFGSYDVTIDVPDGFVVAASAAKLDARTEAGRSITRWHQDDVHDFAWTAWDRFEERSKTVDGLAIRALYPAGHDGDIDREIEAVALGMRCYGRRYGRYPYAQLTIVHPPRGANEAGGMEYPTLITTGGPWWMPAGVRFAESLALHEFGHQHFYGLVATNEHDWPFLDEGLNSYAEEACLREAFGASSGGAIAGMTFGLDVVQRWQALNVGHDAAIAQPASMFPSGGHYGGLVYMRTASLFRTLGGAFGRDTVDRALGRYMRASRFEHPGPDRLLRALRDAGGAELARAARVGLFERGWVDFAVIDLADSKQTQPAGVFDRPHGRETVATGALTGTHQASALIVRRGNLRLPVDIEIVLESGRRERTRWRGQGDWARLEYTGPEAVVAVVVDPDASIELDERRDNNSKQIGASPSTARAFESAAYLTSLISLFFSP